MEYNVANRYRIDFTDGDVRYSVYVDIGNDNTLKSMALDSDKRSLNDQVTGVSRLEVETAADGTETTIDIPIRIPVI